MPSISAVSDTEYPSTSTSTIGARWSSGSSSRASLITSLVSRSAIESRGTAGSWWPCSGSGTVGLACLRRIRSRQAFTTMRCSHVVTCDSARKFEAARKAEMNASCRASAASSGSRTVRRATAHLRSRCLRTSSLNACGSPAACALIRSAAVGSAVGAVARKRLLRTCASHRSASDRHFGRVAATCPALVTHGGSGGGEELHLADLGHELRFLPAQLADPHDHVLALRGLFEAQLGVDLVQVG